MRNFLALIGLLLVLVVGVGVWQGWFKFAVDSNKKVTVEVDGQKATDDTKKFGEAVKDKLDNLKKDSDTSSTGNGK